MRQALLYEKPEDFAKMMASQLRETSGMNVESTAGEPLLLLMSPSGEPTEGKMHVSLHGAYQTYMAGGDLNDAIDHLNDIARTTAYMAEVKNEIRFDPAYLFPAIRDEEYVLESAKTCDSYSEPCLPGLRTIFLEIKDGVTKVAGNTLLRLQPHLTQERVRRLAYRNLNARGWMEPKLVLKSPALPSCTIEFFSDYDHPIDAQFLLPDLRRGNMPDNVVLAFTNRQTAVLMHSTEQMETAEQVMRLVRLSKFREVVRRSVHFLPYPVSDRMYWIRDGEALLLDGKAAR